MKPSQARTSAGRFLRIVPHIIFLFASLPIASSAQTYIFGRADFPTGTEPHDAIVADFNADGIQDLAAANFADNTISILLGKPDGTFSPKTDFGAGLSPTSLVAGDFNGDHKLDIAVANFGELTFWVLLGNGDGTFQAGVPYATRNPPDRLITADFNRDGKLDIATVNTNFVTSPANNSVSILLGNGDGTFTSLIEYPMDGATVSITSGDFNGDGALDLAVANPGLETVFVLLGKGDGTFAAPVSYGSGTGQFVNTDVIARDFNGDGNLDLAACGNGKVSILLGNGDGTFQPRVDYTGVGPDDGGLTTDDFNGDGKLDIAVSNGFGGGPPVPNVSILIGKGDGTFQPPVNYNTGGQPFSVVSADINGDGKPDLVMATQPNTVAVLIGKGDGTFPATNDYTGGAVPMGITTGDFNGDGKIDLATANRGDDTVSVYLANGDGTFQPSASYPAGSVPRAAASADLNGDGKDDLIVADPTCDNIFPPCTTTGTVSVLIANSDGTFRTAVPYPVNGYPMSVVTGDFNKDGKIDVAVANGNSPGTVSLLLGRGDGTLQSPVDYATASTPSAIGVGDFNGDGKLDLAVAAASSTSVISVLLGRGDGTFQSHTDYPVTQNPLSIVVADFNKDGKLDLATVDDQFISVLLGNGNGTFQSATSYDPHNQLPSSVVAGDFNGDGNKDLAVVDYLDNNVTILFGKGDGTFPKTLVYQYSYGSSFGLAAADFRAEGAVDLAVANFGLGGGNSISVLLNEPVAALSPGKLSFASLNVGDSSAPQTIRLSNPGPSPLAIGNIAPVGDFSETNTCAASLAIGAHCGIDATFAPTGPLTRTGSIVVTDNAFGSPQAVFLSGTGIGPGVGFSPAIAAFGGQFIATTSAVKTVTLTNNGNATLTISRISITGVFVQTNNCPASLAPNVSCAIQIKFSPAVVGPAIGSVTVVDNVFGGQSVLALTGTGTDFRISVAPDSSGSATVSAGGTASYKLDVSPEGGLGLNGPVTLACTGAPSQATCSIAPESVTLNGPSAASTTVTVTTTASSTLFGMRTHRPMRLPIIPFWNSTLVMCLAIVVALWLAVRTIDPARRFVRLSIAAMLLAFTMAACGGGGGSNPSHPSTPAGTYTLTVTASFNNGTSTVHHDINLTLAVN